MKKSKKIQAFERDQIALLLASKTSLREIARQLDRAFSSIRDEVKRNSQDGVYQAIRAESFSKKRNLSCRKTNPLKDPVVYSYAVDKLRCGWSPEEIAGRLKKENGGKTVICHETIYRYIYSQEGKEKKLNQYLVRGHKERRRWHGRHKYQRGIPDRISLDLRPEIINQRGRFGDWEIDSVAEKKVRKGVTPGVHTFLERKTRHYQAVLLPNIDSEYGVKAQLKVFGSLPQKARRSATFDNGKENYNHAKLKIFLGMETYFCDPNAAWQKGANEHFNGILRRYIPKKTDLTTLTQFELDEIVEEINNRPLKCLKFETPSEAFARELKSLPISK